MGLPLFVAVLLLSCSSLMTGPRMSAVTFAEALDFSADDLRDATKILSDLPKAFEAFKQNFKKIYSEAGDEEKRFLNFATNIANAIAVQKENPLATFGVTPFSDLSEEEFKAFLTTIPTYTTNDSPDGESSQRRAMDSMGLPIRPDVIYDRESGTVLGPRTPVLFDDLPETFKNTRRRMELERQKLERSIQHDDSKDVPPLRDEKEKAARRHFAPSATTPDKLDWRDHGIVTPVKYQGECGACWAFAVTGNIESLWTLSGFPLVGLSEQQLVSCDRSNQACDGGIMQYAFQWILRENEGYIAREDYYPYVSTDNVIPVCNNVGAGAGAKISNYISIARRETEIMKYVANVGPIAVSIEAYGWQSYTGGIITKCNNLMTTHAVLVVGYDTTNDPPYWILKNQWSNQWGEQGYIRTQMGGNVCLIADNPSTAVIASNMTLEELPVGDPSRIVRNSASGLIDRRSAGVFAASLVASVSVAIVSALFV